MFACPAATLLQFWASRLKYCRAETYHKSEAVIWRSYELLKTHKLDFFPIRSVHLDLPFDYFHSDFLSQVIFQLCHLMIESIVLTLPFRLCASTCRRRQRHRRPVAKLYSSAEWMRTLQTRISVGLFPSNLGRHVVDEEACICSRK